MAEGDAEKMEMLMKVTYYRSGKKTRLGQNTLSFRNALGGLRFVPNQLRRQTREGDAEGKAALGLLCGSA